jgi:hypothetical protein
MNINIQDVYYKKYKKYKKKYLQLKYSDQNGGLFNNIANNTINVITRQIKTLVYINDLVMTNEYNNLFVLNNIYYDSLLPMEKYIITTTLLLKHLKDFFAKTLKTKYLEENKTANEETYNTNKKSEDEIYINSVFINFQTNLIDKINQIINIYKYNTQSNTTSTVEQNKKIVENDINKYIDIDLKVIPNNNQLKTLINKYFNNINIYIHKYHSFYKK